jgi:hypothetical protein
MSGIAAEISTQQSTTSKEHKPAMLGITDKLHPFTRREQAADLRDSFQVFATSHLKRA